MPDDSLRDASLASLLMLRLLSVFTFFGTPFGELAYAYQSNVAGMATLDRDGPAEVVTMFSTNELICS